MKLRNKNTGEIIDSACIGVFKHQSSGDCERVDTEERSLSKFLEQWEDYKPAEPLIKDEEKLDTVKSFFALLGITKEIYYQSINNCFYHSDGDGITYAIDFDNDKGIEKIYTDRDYTIAELCGEEEE